MSVGAYVYLAILCYYDIGIKLEEEGKSMETKKRAVIYARTSSRRQSYDSIVQQVIQCADYAYAHDVEIVEVYEDAFRTGKNANRPAFQKLVKDCRKGRFDYVLILRYDRWARNYDDAVRYEKRINYNGVQLLSITEDKKDKLDLFRKAELYSIELSESVTSVMTHLASEYKYLGGPMTYGYQKDSDGRYQIDEEDAQLVRQIFTQYAYGETADDIAADLNRRFIKPPRGCHWNRKTLQTILQNKTYIGTYTWGDISEKDIVPPIVEKDVFDQVQMKLEENSRRGAHAKSSGEDEFFLSGKLFCGCCGEPLKGNTSNGIKYYKCGNSECKKTSIRKDAFEDMVFDLTSELLVPENVEMIVRSYMECQKNSGPVCETERLGGELYNRQKRFLETLSDGQDERLLKEIDDIQDVLDAEKEKAAILEEDEIRFFLNDVYNGYVDSWHIRKILFDTLIYIIIYSEDVLNIGFNLTSRFMNDRSGTQYRFMVAWHDDDIVFGDDSLYDFEEGDMPLDDNMLEAVSDESESSEIEEGTVLISEEKAETISQMLLNDAGSIKRYVEKYQDRYVDYIFDGEEVDKDSAVPNNPVKYREKK